MLLIENEQRAMQGIARVVIDPRRALPVGGQSAGVCLLRKPARRFHETVAKGRVHLENFIEIFPLDQALVRSREAVIPSLSREGLW
jgi:hypothetical protein